MMRGLTLLLVLRILQAICGLTVLALSSSVAQWYDKETLTPSPGEFNYLVYAALFSCFSVAYVHFIPIHWPRCTPPAPDSELTLTLLYLDLPVQLANYMAVVAHPYTSFLIEGANFITLGGGFVVLVLFLADLKFCRGSVCNSARADVFFCGLSVGLWLFTIFLLGRQILGDRAGGARRGRYAPPPEISQA